MRKHTVRRQLRAGDALAVVFTGKIIRVLRYPANNTMLTKHQKNFAVMETVVEEPPQVAENQGQQDVENAKSKGKMLLQAAASNNTNIVMQYLNEGVDPNVEDSRSWVSRFDC